MEGVLDEAINRAFHDGTPSELRGLRFGARLALAEALEFLDKWSDDNQLRILVAGIWQATGYTLDYAFEKRAEADQAFAAWRKQQALSADQVRELLEGETEAAGNEDTLAGS